MTFPRNSAFDQGAGVPPKAELSDISVRHVGRPNIVEIPISELEGWIDRLEPPEGRSAVDVQDVIDDMRSYFRG